MPERAAPEPQATPPMHPTPLLSVPLPAPQTEMPEPQPLAVLAQPQPSTSPEVRPLTRAERYLAYVRDSNARARAVAAQALLDGGQVSAATSGVPKASP